MKKILKKIALLRHYIRIRMSFFFKRRKERIIIMATPTHGNLGDQAIVYAEKNMLKKICPFYSIIEVENGAYLKCKPLLIKLVRTTDIIIIDGGGNLGTLWSREDDKISDIISTFSQNKIVVFPQTVYYEESYEANERILKNKAIYSQARDLTIMLRDKASFDLFDQVFSNAKKRLCPDIVLSIKKEMETDRNGVLLCLRSDCEKVVDEKQIENLKKYFDENKIKYSNTDTVVKKSVRYYNRKYALQKKWKEFSKAKLVITDRLHAMIFSYITGTPCVAINNKSKKVEGTFRFIKNCNNIRMAKDFEQAKELVPVLMNDVEKNANCFEYPMDVLEEILKYGNPK